MTLGERIAVMKAGSIQQVAAPMELYRRPANLFVAGFIGWPPMNLFLGTVLEKGRALFFQEQAGQGRFKKGAGTASSPKVCLQNDHYGDEAVPAPARTSLGSAVQSGVGTPPGRRSAVRLADHTAAPRRSGLG